MQKRHRENDRLMRRLLAYDQVIALRDGFYAMVDGQMFGPWPMKEYAQAGLQTEQRRAARRREVGR